MMTCDEMPQYLADYLTGTLPPAVQPMFAAHLGTCAACREQAAEAQAVWKQLGALPVPEPGPQVRERFYEMLAAESTAPSRIRFRDWLEQWVPLRQALQFGGALALGVACWIGGSHFAAPKQTEQTPQVVELRKEVDQMRQLVALSLLQQQSASDRMRGVNWSYRVDSDDTEVVKALLRTVDQDANVNVRLAAVDALQKFSGVDLVRQNLTQSLPKQDSPLVQIAIIDMLAQLRSRGAVSTLEKLSKDQSADPMVRQRANWGVRQIE